MKNEFDKISTCKYKILDGLTDKRESQYPAENTAEWALDSHGADRLIMYSLVDRNPRFPSERLYSRHRPSRHTSMVSAPVQAEHLVSLVHKSPTTRTAISLAYVLHFTRAGITATENWAVLRSIHNKRRLHAPNVL